MHATNEVTEDFERWFYGGAPPAGDATMAFGVDPDSEPSVQCRCTKATQALLERLREVVPRPAMAA